MTQQNSDVAIISPSPDRATEVVAVSELEPGDRLVSGNNLGPFNTIDDVTVKKIDSAERGKHYVMFYNVGALFLPSAALVTILDTNRKGASS
jgi:hypothetical protein